MRKIKLLLFIFLAALNFAKAQPYPLNISDRAGLQVLENAGFLPANFLSSLPSLPSPLLSSDISNLQSVGVSLIVDNSEHKVVALDLRGRRISYGNTAPISVAILDGMCDNGNLNRLQRFDISNNNLTGIFGALSTGLNIDDLAIVNISDNQIEQVSPPPGAFCGRNGTRHFIANNNRLDAASLTSIIALCNDNIIDSISLRHAFDSTVTVVDIDASSLNPFCLGDALSYLDLSHNRIESFGTGKIFTLLPDIRHLNLSHNRLQLPFVSAPTTVFKLIDNAGALLPIDVPAFEGLDSLVNLDFSYNNLHNPNNANDFFPLHWFIGKQLNMPTNSRFLRNIKFRNAGLNNIQGIGNFIHSGDTVGVDTILSLMGQNILNTPFFPQLDTVDFDSNSLAFTDLYYAAIQLGLGLNANSAYSTPSGNFFYRYQEPIGIGGIRRRPNNERFDFKIPKSIDNPAQICPSCGNFENVYQIFWKRRQNSTDSVTLFSTGLPIITPSLPTTGVGRPEIDMTRPYIDGLMKVSMTMVDSILDESYVTGKLTNPRFPNVEIFIREKMIRTGQCFDTLGQVVKCQEIAVQIDENINQADLEYHKKYYGAEVIDECVCGKVQLWSLSDTFQTAYLETNGKTTVNQSGTQSRPGLKSADHNYPLLDNNNNWTANPNLATAVTNATTDTARVLIAIIDSGTDIDHPRINPFIKRNTYETVTHPSPMSLDSVDNDQNCEIDDVVGYNYLDRTNIAYDDHGHGTAVSGIAVGLGSPALAPENQQAVSILPIKYTNRKNEGSTFHASCGIYYAAEYNKNHSSNSINPLSSKVRIINASWGYRGESCVVLKDAIEYAGEQNILFVCATGNDGISLDTAKHYPSNYPLSNILAVTAIDSDNSTISSYANRGAMHADIAAYGTYSVLMQPHDLIGQPTDSTTVQQEGTSFSTPMVARAAAVLIHEFKDASYCDVKAALMESALPLNSSDSNSIRSRGYVDINSARAYMRNMILGQSICDTLGNVSTILPIVENSSNSNNTSSYRLFPNPTQNTLYVEFLQTNASNQPITVSILDAKGQILYNQIFAQNSNQISISTANLAQGFYILQIKSNKGTSAEKFIKMD